MEVVRPETNSLLMGMSGSGKGPVMRHSSRLGAAQGTRPVSDMGVVLVSLETRSSVVSTGWVCAVRGFMCAEEGSPPHFWQNHELCHVYQHSCVRALPRASSPEYEHFRVPVLPHASTPACEHSRMRALPRTSYSSLENTRAAAFTL